MSLLSFSVREDSVTAIMTNLRTITEELMQQFFEGMDEYLLLLERTIKRNITANFRQRTGTLRASIGHQVHGVRDITRSGYVLTGRIGTRVIYARIHEYGGIILPVRARFLTIPFPGIKQRATWYLNTFIKNSIIYQRFMKGREWGIRPLFLLKKYVTMPARPYMRPALETTAGDFRRILTRKLAE